MKTRNSFEEERRQEIAAELKKQNTIKELVTEMFGYPVDSQGNPEVIQGVTSEQIQTLVEIDNKLNNIN